MNNFPFSKLDKAYHEYISVERLSTKSFALQGSTKNMKKRRDAFIRTLGLNSVSKYIPLFVEGIDDIIDSWTVGKEFDFLVDISSVTFNVMSTILFGEEVLTKMDNWRYIDENQKVQRVSYKECLRRVASDLFQLVSSPAFILSPSMATFFNFPSLKRNNKNIEELHKNLKKFWQGNIKEDWVYSKVIRDCGLTEDEALADTVLLLIAGLDTTSHLITSALYNLKKSGKLGKLRDELNKVGISKDSDFCSEEVKEAIHNCNYLSYCFKETARIDPPGAGTLLRVAFEDIKICGVTIPKGSWVIHSFLYSHFNYEYWHEPAKFIPERFDPDHPYSFLPTDKTKRRNPLCYTPFSQGARKCPGQVLATTEAKFIIARLVAKIDYDVNEEQLKKDDLKFITINPFPLLMTYRGEAK